MIHHTLGLKAGPGLAKHVLGPRQHTHIPAQLLVVQGRSQKHLSKVGHGSDVPFTEVDRFGIQGRPLEHVVHVLDVAQLVLPLLQSLARIGTGPAEHAGHGLGAPDIPRAQIAIEGRGFPKDGRKIRHAAHVPLPNVFVEGFVEGKEIAEARDIAQIPLGNGAVLLGRAVGIVHPFLHALNQVLVVEKVTLGSDDC